MQTRAPVVKSLDANYWAKNVPQQLKEDNQITGGRSFNQMEHSIANEETRMNQPSARG